MSGVATLNGLVLMQSISGMKRKGQIPRRRQSTVPSAPACRSNDCVGSNPGFRPNGVATGAGAEVQKPLAAVVIGGLTTSTILTLFVLPTLAAWASSKIRRTSFPQNRSPLPAK